MSPTSPPSAGAPTVTLIDASPYIFRAYFSLPESLATPDGEPANAVYGFASFLVKLLDTERPTHLAAAFDGSLTTSFRNELFPDYKAQREPPPPELEAQMGWCREVAEALGIPTFIDERYEADDIVAALWHQHRRKGRRVIVVTSDKDLAQLIDEGTEVLDFARDERWDAAAVLEKFSVHPRQIPDYLGLAGDKVDNIPGVQGVGAKTAAALLAELGTLEAIYEDLERVTRLDVRGAQSLTAKLARQKETALLSKRLATVAVDAPFAASLAQLEHRGADPAKIDPLFERLGFEGIRERIPRWR
jgi:5'-3' exonuclease